MASTTLDLPPREHLRIKKAVVSKVEGNSKSVGGELIGIRWHQLRDFIVNQISDQERLADDDDDEYSGNQKLLAAAIVKRLCREEVLKGAKQENGHSHYIVHSLCKNMDGTLNQTARQLTDSPLVGDSIEVEGASEADTEAERHANAYAEMTKLAIPQRRDLNEDRPSRLPSETPSRKRCRPVEIADSDASSRNATISPRRGSNTTSEVGRLARRLATPEENRRVSAPSRLRNATPDDGVTPKRRRYHERESTAIFKEERQQSSPQFIILAVAELRAEYVNDKLRCDGDFVKCLDCDERRFAMTSITGKLVTRNILQHLNGNSHKNKVAERIAQEGKKHLMMESFSSILPNGIPKDNLIDFPAPPPILAFSLPNLPEGPSHSAEGDPDLRRLRASYHQGADNYMKALEDDNATRRMRTSFVERRLDDLQSRNDQRFEELKANLSDSKVMNETQVKEMTDALASHNAETKEQFDRVEQMITTAQSSLRDQGTSMDDMHGIITNIESRNLATEERLEETEGSIRRTDSKYFELVGRQGDLKLETQKLATQVESIKHKHQQVINDALTEVHGCVSDSAIRQRDELDGALAEVTIRVDKSEARQQEERQLMEQKLVDANQSTMNQIGSISTRILDIKQKVANSQSVTTDHLKNATKQLEDSKQRYGVLEALSNDNFDSLTADIRRVEDRLGVSLDVGGNMRMQLENMAKKLATFERLDVDVDTVRAELAGMEQTLRGSINSSNEMSSCLKAKLQKVEEKLESSAGVGMIQINSLKADFADLSQKFTACEDLGGDHIISLNRVFQEMKQKVSMSESLGIDKFKSLERDVATLKRHTKESFSPIMKRVLALERAKSMPTDITRGAGLDWHNRLLAAEGQLRRQDDSTNDVESKVQIHAEEFQRQRKNEEAFKKSVSAKVDAFIKQAGERNVMSDSQMSERVEARERENEVRVKDLESQVEVHSDELHRQRKSEEAFKESIFVQMDAYAKQIGERNEMLGAQMNEKLEAAEKTSSARINELVSQVLILSDDLRRQRDNEGALRVSLIAQMDANTEQSSERNEPMEVYVDERIEATINEKIVAVVQAKSNKIEELEETIKKQEAHIQGHYEMFSELFAQMEDFKNLATTVESIQAHLRKPRSSRAQILQSVQAVEGVQAVQLVQGGARRRMSGPRPV